MHDCYNIITYPSLCIICFAVFVAADCVMCLSSIMSPKNLKKSLSLRLTNTSLGTEADGQHLPVCS